VRCGFTLVEMLVVTLLIAVLISLLLPILWWAKEEAKRTVCSGNHRQLVVAALQYAQSNQGLLVPALTNPTAWVNVGNDPASIASGLLFKYVNAGNDPFGGQPSNAGLIAAIDNNPPLAIKVYVCPSDFVETNIRTYSINSYLNGYEGPPLLDRVITRMSQLKQPSTTFYYIDEFDNRGFNVNGFEVIPSYYGPPSNQSFGDIPGRFHLDGNNLSYADGHAEWWAWSDPRTLALQTGSFFTPSPGNIDLYRLQGVIYGNFGP
jgi:prepilin-type N-terminal cleavage/methylation domain-containing protein/prepilin-type processing-associated H-X9-DG protein